MKSIVKYQLPNGKIPFDDWLNTLDKSCKAEVLIRIERIKYGLLGKYRNLANGISEIKFHNGNRVYFAEKDNTIIILLIGGNKQRQSNDIRKAEVYFKDFLERDKNE